MGRRMPCSVLLNSRQDVLARVRDRVGASRYGWGRLARRLSFRWGRRVVVVSGKVVETGS